MFPESDLPQRKLAHILDGSEILSISDSSILEQIVAGVDDHSQRIKAGEVFFAIPGTVNDGQQFVADAVRNGAIAVVGEFKNTDSIKVPYVRVADVRAALAHAANCLQNFPASSFLNFAVTGTNGKTTVTWIIAEALARLGLKTAYVGTLGMHLVSEGENHQHLCIKAEKLTTPGSISVFSYLSSALKEGTRATAMEVSSHAIHQSRVKGVDWDCGIFTNLTRDHLDYHGTLENYAATKLKLFTELLTASTHKPKLAVINQDDTFGKEILNELRAIPELTVLSYSSSGDKSADCYVTAIEFSPRFTKIELSWCGETVALRVKLIGDYNVDNMLAAFTALVGKGYGVFEIVKALADVPSVPGRLQLVSESGTPIFVDYAHTPDALLRAQQSIRKVSGGRLITVFGCGGDRDRGKRPLMGREVAIGSDLAIVTSDNPRTENPEAIVADIVPGFSGNVREGFSYEVIVDRRQAIQRAVTLAAADDTILIAGKGHEDYQEIQGERKHFSDCEVSLEALNEQKLRSSKLI